MDPGSSPETVVTETPVTETAVDANTATETSSASETKGEASLLDTVTAALKGEKEQPPGSERDPVDPAATQAKDQKSEATPEAELGDPTEAELKQYGPKTQKRIRQLLGQRDEARTELDRSKSRAANFDTIDQFAKQHRMTPDDMSASLQIGALIASGDPSKALQVLAPIMERLNKDAGNVLPTELQERVDLGYISAEDARRLHQAELREGRTRQVSEAERQEQAQRQAESEARRIVDDAKSTGEAWEAARKNNDPDWPLKQKRFTELVELDVRRNGFPSSKKHVQEMLDTIAKDVDAEFARFVPKRKEVRNVTSTASPRASAEPKTALEAARQALASM